MELSVLWAVLNLGLASCNDFVFKLFQKKKRSLGLFVAVIGLIWVFVVLGMNGKTVLGLCPKASLVWGLICGFFSVTANILLIRSMHYESVGVCSTLYRLNLVPVTVLAWLLLGERLSGRHTLGILISLVAILLFFPWGSRSGKNKGAVTGISLAVSAMLLRAFMGICYSYALKSQGAVESGINLMNSLCWIIGGLLWYLFAERRRITFGAHGWKYGILSGLLVFGICLTLARSLAGGQASVVLPIMQMSFVLTFLMGVLFLHEKAAPGKILGAVLGVIGILLLSVK